jgi:23S rRNA pseudouridine2605 synthase
MATRNPRGAPRGARPTHPARPAQRRAAPTTPKAPAAPARPAAPSHERLQKVLARAGVASRRAAEELISAGRVRVDGRVVTELGTKVDPRASAVEVDGKRVLAESLAYVVLHKPRNVVATMSDPEGRPTVRELLAEVPGRVYPVGRLDFSTSGVLLATNDGDFAAALLHPRKAVPKTYVVKVQGVMEEPDIEQWRRGVKLEDGQTLPAKVTLIRHEEGKTWFELTITEGRNQQIRRMGDATGFRVMRLARTEFAGISSEGLAPGRWRYMSRDELTAFKEAWGVPRRIVSPPAEAPARRFGRAPGIDEHGRATSRDARDSRDRRDPREPAGNRDRGEGQGGPRYGGGSPGRRDLGTTEDWGGGIRRGSSGSRDGQNDRAGQGGASDAPPGRGGRSRTTGTGGGVGASGDDASYRVKGRRGW